MKIDGFIEDYLGGVAELDCLSSPKFSNFFQGRNDLCKVIMVDVKLLSMRQLLTLLQTNGRMIEMNKDNGILLGPLNCERMEADLFLLLPFLVFICKVLYLLLY